MESERNQDTFRVRCGRKRKELRQPVWKKFSTQQLCGGRREADQEGKERSKARAAGR